VTTSQGRRPGSETRAEILRVALELFTRKGFEGTSIRDLAEELKMTKSSLYYHFAGKDEIVKALLASRKAEIDDLLAWIAEQPRDETLLRRAALRWVDSTTSERLQAQRFAHANRPAMSRLAADHGDIRPWFDQLLDAVLPSGATPAERVRARMAFDTVSAALFASHGLDITEPELLEAARAATLALTAPA
jgi:AcrR family transcriptional regulator